MLALGFHEGHRLAGVRGVVGSLLGHVSSPLVRAPALPVLKERQRRRPQPAQRHRAASRLLVILPEGPVLDMMQPVLDAPVAPHETRDPFGGKRARTCGAGQKIVMDFVGRHRIAGVSGKVADAAGDDLHRTGPQFLDVGGSLCDPV